jgi:hypothetical protein
MPLTTRAQDFDDQEPKLSPEEVAAAKLQNKIAVSFKGVPVPVPSLEIEYLAVKFAFADGTFVTLLLDQFAGRALHGLLSTVNGLNWSGVSVLPTGPARH